MNRRQEKRNRACTNCLSASRGTKQEEMQLADYPLQGRGKLVKEENKRSAVKKVLLFAAVMMVCASCGGQRAKNSAGTETEASAPPPEYAIPRIPAMISEPADAADWMARHFWDNFDFRDTLAVERWSDYAEQAFVNYTHGLLLNVPREMGEGSLKILFQKASADKVVFRKFAGIADKYLYEPNSPYLDEEYYITVLGEVLANPALDQYERIKPEEQLRMALKNRIGKPAADFRYTLDSGASGTLYGLRAPYTLVFINNPGCSACRDIKMQITESAFLSRLIEDGSLAVLAIYPDEDLTEWREHAPEMPADWINSYDKELKIKNDELYDLKAIPTLYLLDRAKRVMLKDVMSVPLIEDTINKDLQ